MTDTLSLDDLPTPEQNTTIPPDELEVDGDNPNEMDDATFELLVDRIERRGWIGNAIIADTDGVIADGEHRWRVAHRLGLTEVPVKIYDFTETERRIVRQELNKIRGHHVTAKDHREFERLFQTDQSDEIAELIDATSTHSVDDILSEIETDTHTDVGSIEFNEYDASIADDYEPADETTGTDTQSTTADPDIDQSSVVCPNCGHEFHPESID